MLEDVGFSDAPDFVYVFSRETKLWLRVKMGYQIKATPQEKIYLCSLDTKVPLEFDACMKEDSVVASLTNFRKNLPGEHSSIRPLVVST